MNTRIEAAVGGSPRRAGRALGRLARGLHRDERGAMSILTVFAVLVLTMVMGMVMNAGRQADAKVRLQNAADSVAYSGGAMLARGMNALAFSNHLLCEVFAMTAIMREARDAHADEYAREILDAWSDIGPVFQGSSFQKFSRLGQAITRKVPLEQQMAAAYSAWLKAQSADVLPILEEILLQQMIPRYQQALVQAWPGMVQAAASEVAQRNGAADPDAPAPDADRGPLLGAIWRGNGAALGSDGWSLPVVDPAAGGVSAATSRSQRETMAFFYANNWLREMFWGFDHPRDGVGKMSQYGNLFRAFTCLALKRLLDENHDQNLLFVIDRDQDGIESLGGGATSYLADNFTFVGVGYWRRLPELMSALYLDATESDSLAYAEVRLFAPKRLFRWHQVGGGSSVPPRRIGGVPGESPTLPGDSGATNPGSGSATYWVVAREARGWRNNDAPSGCDDWSLLNQNWRAQIVPTSQVLLGDILEGTPPLPEFASASFRMPRLGGMQGAELQWISPH